MLQRLIAKLRPWGEAIAALDDPYGDLMSRLDDRVSRLEGEMQALRKPRQSDGA
jgi:hypothetical protein